MIDVKTSIFSRKGIRALCIILFIILAMGNVFVIRCRAENNHGDTVYSYKYDNDRVEITDLATPERGKWDDSSAYVYNKSSKSAISYIRVMSGGRDYTQGARQSCAVGQAKYLYNLVYESGRRQCGLVFDPGDGHHVQVYLLWSPDSV